MVAKGAEVRARAAGRTCCDRWLDVRRLDSLTGLRFLAALSVFIFHADHLLGLPALIAAAGSNLAVPFFFALSGFVLTWSRRVNEGAARFYWHRFARVWPLHALTSLLALAFGLTAAGSGAIWRDLSLVHGWLPHRAYLVGPSWSIAAEAFYYLLFPALLLWLHSTRLRTAAKVLVAVPLITGLVASAVAPSIAADPFWGFRVPPAHLYEFAAGMALATAMLRGWRPRMGLGSALALTVMLYALLRVWDPPGWWREDLVTTVAFLALIATAATCDIEARPSWLACRPMETLGRWSFALYLVHFPVLLGLERAGASGLGAAIVGLLACLLLSGALHVGFERPVERWLRSRWRRPAVPGLEPAPA